jgi:hypothetical protein
LAWGRVQSALPRPSRPNLRRREMNRLLDSCSLIMVMPPTTRRVPS